MAAISDQTFPYAIQAHGKFASINLRSLRKQTQPYLKLADAAKQRNKYDTNNLDGTLVCFWFQDFLDGLAVPGMHCHLLSDDHKTGGYVLGVSTTASAKASLQQTPYLHINLPSAG